jgi:hypothetical protein
MTAVGADLKRECRIAIHCLPGFEAEAVEYEEDGGNQRDGHQSCLRVPVHAIRT